MNNIPGSNPFDLAWQMMRAWMPAGIAAPDSLTQSILPGWSLISVNQGNSSAPDTEQAIVAKASYGKQLGQIMDALDVVIRTTKLQPEDPDDEKAIATFTRLVSTVKDTKADAAEVRIKRLRSDLELLEKRNPAEYQRQRQALMAFLRTHEGD